MESCKADDKQQVQEPQHPEPKHEEKQEQQSPVLKHLHTDCRSGKSVLATTATTQVVGGDVMTFVPFALFKQGTQVHSKSVGYHSDGDVVLLKEEVSSSSDSEAMKRSRDYQGRSVSSSRLTTTHRTEQTLNEKRIEKRGIRAFPGVTGPKGKQKHRRWRNQFFLHDDVREESAGAPLRPNKMTKSDFQELFTHRSQTQFHFHDDEGRLDRRWSPFVEVTEEQQAKLLRRYAPSQPQPSPAPSGAARFDATPSQRWGRIGKPLRSELVRLKGKRDNFIAPVEERLLQYISEIDQSHDDCTEVQPLVLRLDDGYHRMLCHGIVSYYLLTSASHTDADTDIRYTMVHCPRAPPHPFPLPSVSLVDFLSSQGSGDSGGRGRKKKPLKKNGKQQQQQQQQQQQKQKQQAKEEEQ